MITKTRKTKETEIALDFDLQGGQRNINTGIGFFDHMLDLFAAHSGFSLTLTAAGDLNVDCHHTVEDTGIVLGEAFKAELSDKAGIKRYATFFLPMDETLVMVSVDISGRPLLVCDLPLKNSKVGDFDGEMTEEFLRAFAFNAGITLHVRLVYGSNKHHIIEAVFKGLARALREATAKTGSDEIPSTKGVL